jgi:hypothetical protein
MLDIVPSKDDGANLKNGELAMSESNKIEESPMTPVKAGIFGGFLGGGYTLFSIVIGAMLYASCPNPGSTTKSDSAAGIVFLSIVMTSLICYSSVRNWYWYYTEQKLEDEKRERDLGTDK